MGGSRSGCHERHSEGRSKQRRTGRKGQRGGAGGKVCSLDPISIERHSQKQGKGGRKGEEWWIVFGGLATLKRRSEWNQGGQRERGWGKAATKSRFEPRTASKPKKGPRRGRDQILANTIGWPTCLEPGREGGREGEPPAVFPRRSLLGPSVGRKQQTSQRERRGGARDGSAGQTTFGANGGERSEREMGEEELRGFLPA